MKKSILGIIAIVSLGLVSCQKEKDYTPENNNTQTPENVVEGSIPTTITGIIQDVETRTAYDADGKFTWTSSDQVRLLVCEDLSTYSRQGIYSYKVKSLSDGNRTAVFTSTSSAGDLTAFVDGTWKSTGIAMYPASALDRFNTPESHSYGTPWFTLARSGNVSGLASDIILTGAAMSDNSNFKFSTAMGVLKLTVRNIPASAAAIKLCTSDKTNYPIDGDFALTKNGEKVDMSFIDTYVSDFKGYQKVDLSSEGEIAERSFYFNIPAVSYPANTLSVRIEDANGGMILFRNIGAKLNIACNECLEVPELSIVNDCEIGGEDVKTPRVVWSIDSKQLIFAVNQKQDLDLSDFPSGYKFTNNDEKHYASSTSGYPVGYSMTALNPNPFSGSGLYYLHYVILSSTTKPSALTDANVVKYGTIPFYYLSSADATSFAKQYTFTKTDGMNFWHPGTGSNYATTMTLAVSDDVTKGNLMISALYGKTGAHKKIYGVLPSSDATSMTFAYNGDGDDEYFFYDNGNYFYVAQGAAHSADVSSDIVFTIASGPVLTCDNYLMMKYYKNNQWNEFISGVGLVFN